MTKEILTPNTEDKPFVDSDGSTSSGDNDRLNKNWTPLIVAIVVVVIIVSLFLIA